MSQNLIKPVENEDSGEAKNAKFGKMIHFPRRVWGLKRDFSKSEKTRILNRLEGGDFIINSSDQT